MFQQVANVAFLPGIVEHSLAMPDIHWGYGFPIGGVAATNIEDGVVSPGGVGFDINCGVRLLRTNLTEEEVRPKIEKLIAELFKSKRIKDWYRAYFNYGIINYIKGNKRLLPCEMGISSFYLDPYGELRPCNALCASMGNLNDKSFSQIWQSQEAGKVRELVTSCVRNCWMIGSVSEVMKKNIFIPTKWVIKNKFFSLSQLTHK